MIRTRLNRHSVVAAAADLADRHGLEGVTVTAVARTLGVQPASLYEHVRGLADLLDEMQRRALADLATGIVEGVAGRSGYAALQGLARAHEDCATRRPGAWSVLQRPASKETALSPEAAQVASLILAVTRAYPVPEGALVDAVRLVAATINGFLNLAGSDAFDHRDHSKDGSWKAAIDALDRALSTWPAGEAGEEAP